MVDADEMFRPKLKNYALLSRRTSGKLSSGIKNQASHSFSMDIIQYLLFAHNNENVNVSIVIWF